MRLRAVTLFLLAAIALPAADFAPAAGQDRATQQRIIHDIETRGFSDVTGLSRRGGNYLFQARDLFGNKVRVVMNIETGEIVGLSRVRPRTK
jgi:hypothetical protein